ncbi:unnamed protein product [Eretmochelys imbricata]
MNNIPDFAMPLFPCNLCSTLKSKGCLPLPMRIKNPRQTVGQKLQLNLWVLLVPPQLAHIELLRTIECAIANKLIPPRPAFSVHERDMAWRMVAAVLIGQMLAEGERTAHRVDIFKGVLLLLPAGQICTP